MLIARFVHYVHIQRDNLVKKKEEEIPPCGLNRKKKHPREGGEKCYKMKYDTKRIMILFYKMENDFKPVKLFCVPAILYLNIISFLYCI